MKFQCNIHTVPYWEHGQYLPGNYPVSTVGMVIYHNVDRIWIIIVTPNFLYNIYDQEKSYPGKAVNIHIHLLINIIQENNRVITTKEVKGKLPLFCGNGFLITLPDQTKSYVC